MLTMLERTSIKEPRVQRPIPELKVPEARPTWPKVVRWTAVGLAGIGVGAALGLGAVNSNDVDSLRSDVSTLQSELTVAQDTINGLRADLIGERSGYSLEREHLAQKPVSYKFVYEHLARAPDTG
ncbi:MAG TPA: hypothetical protein VFV76_15640 [Actinomycetes bacterium]|nr:hypothetical protein [Actinomycetes bacterium]